MAGINTSIDHLRNSISGAINNARLPMGIVELVLKDIMSEVQIVKLREIDFEKQQEAQEEAIKATQPDEKSEESE